MLRSNDTIRFQVTSLTDDAHGEHEGPVNCPSCSSSLDVLQPDPEDPGRLLWICYDCKSWYVLGRDRRDEVVLVTLPTPTESVAAQGRARA
jgi:hypothetical protein